jgi:hypothetical protein
MSVFKFGNMSMAATVSRTVIGAVVAPRETAAAVRRAVTAAVVLVTTYGEPLKFSLV